MLVLTRKVNQSIFIGDKVKVTVVELKGNQVRLGIEAPPDTKIYREEIKEGNEGREPSTLPEKE